MKKGYIYLCISILSFSTIEIVSKSIVNDFHPLQMNFLRFLIGGIVLLPFAFIDIKKRNLKLSLKDILVLAALGILAVPVSMSCFQMAITYINASVMAVFLSSNPIFISLFSFFILKEKADKAVIISLLLGITGIVVIVYPSFTIANGTLVGMLYGIAAPVTFSLFTVLGKLISPRIGEMVLNDIVFLSGSVLMLPFMVSANIPVFSGINLSNILPLLYLGFVVTAAGYIFLFKGLSYTAANKGSLVFFMKPFVAGSLSYLILKESFSPYLLAGTLLIMGGILSTLIFKNSPSRREKKEIYV